MNARRPVPWERNWPSLEWQLDWLCCHSNFLLVELDWLFVFVGEFRFHLAV